MAIPSFTFTRNPSVKVSVAVTQSGLVAAPNALVIIGRRGASGGSATTNVPVVVTNYGDPTAAATEATALFGATSEVGEMIVAAVKGNAFGGVEPKVYPKITAIAMANDDDSSDLAASLAANITLPMDFVVVPFPVTDATARAALKSHLLAISASDRGENAQFGSFGIMATDGSLSAATTAGEAAASQVLSLPWLRDSGGSKANKIHAVAAAYAAVCAGLGVPYLPLNGVTIGGLVAPASAADYHSSGDAGTVSLGLDSGLVPLTIGTDGSVKISRTITSLRTVSGTPDSAYYDMQDWKVLYYYRMNAFLTAKQPRYAVAKATDQKLLSLKSELIVLAKTFEELEMFQHVDDLAKDFTVARQPSNRHAAVYGVPVNVVPGFHNKGIGVEGTQQYDSFVL